MEGAQNAASPSLPESNPSRDRRTPVTARNYSAETRRRNELAKQRGFTSYAQQRRHAGRVHSLGEFKTLPAPARERRNKALQVIERARAEKIPVSQAAAEQDVPLAAVRWWAGDALDHRRAPEPQAKRADRLIRIRPAIVDGKVDLVITRGSNAARLADEAFATQVRYIQGNADPAELSRFRGKRVAGQVIETDPAALDEIARRGDLGDLPDMYRAVLG
jgi:hypothetical protein